MKNLKKLNKELMNEADKINEKFALLQKKYNFKMLSVADGLYIYVVFESTYVCSISLRRVSSATYL